ncbi:MAG: Asp23/Gls24 family envelope stress response protein [Opitutales bacterium]|nr:Asp23/Gls24 family envelope stress response protein [Opitutales bacterium]
MQENENQDELEASISIQEDSDLGSIHINHEVVATIVSLAAREVPGVVSLAGGSIRDGLTGFLGGRRSDIVGVSISEDEDKNYVIGVKVILLFGSPLAKVAEDIQIAVRDQVENMTNKDVARVDVVVDGIKRVEPEDEDNGDD